MAKSHSLRDDVRRALKEHPKYLLSLGISSNSLHWHRYFYVKKKRKVNSTTILGFKITWTTYRVVGDKNLNTVGKGAEKA